MSKPSEIDPPRDAHGSLPELPRSVIRLFAVILAAAALAFLVSQLVAADGGRAPTAKAPTPAFVAPSI